METNWPWNWRSTVPKITKMTLVRPLMTSFRMTARDDCVVSTRSALLLSTKALAHWLSVGGVGLWTDVCPLLAPSQMSASEIKQTFLSTNLASLMALSGELRDLHLSVTKSPFKMKNSLINYCLNILIPQMDSYPIWVYHSRHSQGSLPPLCHLKGSKPTREKN